LFPLLHCSNVACRELYQQLLQRVESALAVVPSGGPTIHHAFLAIVQSIRDADTTPPYTREDYPKVVYWTKAEYLKDNQSNRGAL